MTGLALTHHGALTAFARSRCSSPSEADDIVQETYTRAWKYRSSFDPDKGSARMWLFGICRNQLLERRSTLPVPPDAHGGVHDDVELHRVVEASFVAEMLRRLSPEHRQVVVLANEGFTTREIAVRLGIAPGTVKSRLHYGLRALRSLLEAEGVLS